MSSDKFGLLFVDVSDDGSLAVASGHNLVAVFDIVCYRHIQTLDRKLCAAVCHAVFDSDESKIHVVMYDGRLRTWDFLKDKLAENVRLPVGPITSTAVASDRQSILLGDAKGRLAVFHPRLKRAEPIGHCPFLITTTALSESGRLAAVGDMDRNIYIWDTKTKQAVVQYHLPSTPLSANIRGSKAIFGLSNGKLAVVDYDDCQLVPTVLKRKKIVGMDADDQRVIAASAGGSIAVMHRQDGRFELSRLLKSHMIRAIRLIRPCKLAAISAIYSGDLLVFDLEQATLKRRICAG